MEVEMRESEAKEGRFDDVIKRKILKTEVENEVGWFEEEGGGDENLKQEPLPLRFDLVKTFSYRFDSPMVPILFVRTPYHVQLTEAEPSEDVESDRFFDQKFEGVTSPLDQSESSLDIVRLLDPEHLEPFVSLARLLLLAKPNPISATKILKELAEEPQSSNFDCKKTHSLILNGFAPFPDIWVTLPIARKFAIRYGLLETPSKSKSEAGLLSNLLSWKTRSIWSLVFFGSKFNELSNRRRSGDHPPVDDEEIEGDLRRGELISNWRIPEKVLPLKECSVEQMKRTIFVDVEIPKKTIEDQHLIRIPFSIPRSISKLPQRPKESFKLPLILSKICINASETIEIEQTIHENAKNNSRADDDDEDEKTLISIDELEVKNIELMKDIIDLNSTLNLKDSIFPNSKDKAVNQSEDLKFFNKDEKYNQGRGRNYQRYLKSFKTLIYLNDMLLSVYKINSHQIKRRSRYFKIFKNRQDVNDRLIREYSLKEFLMNEREDELIKKIDRSMQMIGRVENRLIAIESMVSKNRCEQTDEDGLEKLKAVKTTAKGFFEVKKGTTSVSTSDFFARVWNFEGPDYTKGNFNGLVILIAIILLVLLICTSQ